ncbi:uncharacterized protein LOC126723780 [Quercus robur]|uniref:uncharacterized protein LOC126723780 n=1 Tax=Quercus robur TaxID=38942 RepID=UPI002161A3E3|nr:uncharacterized protein LOC126723780 [Quercus robur]
MDLGVTIAIPTPVYHPWRHRKKTTGNAPSHNPSPVCKEPAIQAAILQEKSPAEMSFQRGRVTLSQILAIPIMSQAYTPPSQAATIPAAPSAPPVIAVADTPASESRAGRKRLKGSSSSRPVVAPDFENYPPDLGDIHVDAKGASTYVKAFMVDEEQLPATDRVRPWREGHGGKVAECVGKALLFPEDMNHWVKWDDEFLLLNMNGEAIMGYQCSMVVEERFLAAKAKAEELSNDNEDLLKKILDVMNKVYESKRLRFEAEENIKAITERKEALRKELQEMKKAFVEKDAELKGYVAVDDAKVQDAYYQGQYDCIASVKPEVQ